MGSAPLAMTDAPPSAGERLPRRFERFHVAGCRTIACRSLPLGQQLAGPWVPADILDISRGGLCLLLPSPLELQPGEPLQLDLRAHPAFGTPQATVRARWAGRSLVAPTLGVAFEPQLSAIPRLEPERRAARRDPNVAPWPAP